MNNLRLVICDIDSTLVNSKRELTPRTKEAIEILHKHGVYFGLASGRPVDELKRYAQEYGLSFNTDFVIGMNGSELWDELQQKEYDYFQLKKEWIREIIELMEPFDTNPFVYYHGKILAKKMNDMMIKSARSSKKEVILAKDISDLYAEENAKIMFRMEESLMPAVEAYIKEHPSPYYSGFKTQTTLMEFADKRISKAYALKKICEMNDLPLDQVMAFGDTTNDNEMIEVSGWGVCMINGSEDTKAVADDITIKDNNEDGLAIYLEDHVFSKYGWI